MESLNAMKLAIQNGDERTFKAYFDEFSGDYIFEISMLIAAVQGGSLVIFQHLLSRYSMMSRALEPVLVAAAKGSNPGILTMLQRRMGLSNLPTRSPSISRGEGEGNENYWAGAIQLQGNAIFPKVRFHECKSCGTTTEQGDNFCTACGSKV